MTRPRSNAISGHSDAVIKVEGLPASDDFMEGLRINATYLPAPGNPRFLAAFVGSRRGGHPCKGWKMHVSAYPWNAQRVAELVLPVLCEMRIWHKYVKSAQALSEMQDGQAGKFITIYTRDTDERDLAGQRVNNLLRNQAGVLGPRVDGEEVLYPMVSCRWSDDYTRPGG